MATLQLTFSDLYNRVAKYLGTYGSSGPTGANLTDAKDLVNDAYTKFVTAHDWSFLKPAGELITMTGEYIYLLPTDWNAMLTELQFDSNQPYPDVAEVALESLMGMRATNTMSKYPEVYAIRPTTHNNTVGQSWEILLYPTPDSAFTLHYRYQVVPAKLENDADVPIGGAEYTQILRQMVIAEGEVQKDKTIGAQSQVAQQMLQTAITADFKRNPHTLGYNGIGGSPSAWQSARGSYRVNDVTFTTD